MPQLWQSQKQLLKQYYLNSQSYQHTPLKVENLIQNGIKTESKREHQNV